MKTINAKTPTELGLSLVILSGPIGRVRDKNWPCIEYVVELQDVRRKKVWGGEYRLGVGHVKFPKKFEEYPNRITQDEMSVLNTIRMKPSAVLSDKQLWANVAAKLAIVQKVQPKLEDVCHSILSDGSAFFDGETFESWASNFGYDSDSIKAKAIFDECDKTGREIMRALSRDDLEALREWASNY